MSELVFVDNFVRAETARIFDDIAAQAGGIRSAPMRSAHVQRRPEPRSPAATRTG